MFYFSNYYIYFMKLTIESIHRYITLYRFYSIITYYYTLTVGFTVIFIHASLRLRNLKNKVARHVEYIGIRRTPMGFLLESIGMEQEAGS